jgi:hypothetical protein
MIPSAELPRLGGVQHELATITGQVTIIAWAVVGDNHGITITGGTT